MRDLCNAARKDPNARTIVPSEMDPAELAKIAENCRVAEEQLNDIDDSDMDALEKKKESRYPARMETIVGWVTNAGAIYIIFLCHFRYFLPCFLRNYSSTFWGQQHARHLARRHDIFPPRPSSQ